MDCLFPYYKPVLVKFGTVTESHLRKQILTHGDGPGLFAMLNFDLEYPNFLTSQHTRSL